MPVSELSREQENVANEMAERFASVRVSALTGGEDVLMTGLNEEGQPQETYRVDEDGKTEVAEYASPTARERLEASDVGPSEREPQPVSGDRYRVFVGGRADTASRTAREAASRLRWGLLTGQTVQVVRHDARTGKERKLTSASLNAVLAELSR